MKVDLTTVVTQVENNGVTAYQGVCYALKSVFLVPSEEGITDYLQKRLLESIAETTFPKNLEDIGWVIEDGKYLPPLSDDQECKDVLKEFLSEESLTEEPSFYRVTVTVEV